LPGAGAGWSTLRLENGHYVDGELANSYSDLVYCAKLDGREALVYVLFEHQSTGDPRMPFRLLRYEVRIWDRWLDDQKGATTLPAIIPVVLCHAEGGWNKAVRWVSSMTCRRSCVLR
jgi:predicted transposase/invertase (TIGR01784 family)